MPTLKKPVDVAVFNSTQGKWQHPSYFRAEVRVILGNPGKPMPEATFKTRLALLEAECPEFQRAPYRRTFSPFHLNCLLTLETWIQQANRCIATVRERLTEEGLPTHEYECECEHRTDN
ncbi:MULTISPECIES: hypothetical protein [unclassified Microcoleus]|uniref:hypothetical protein n=1 Tax=unclassified Microcoleus TaxID=2642155 RepID=UPI001D611B37|nr:MULTISPECIES: hypothetical protein [unclassified Microcoleus]MCC3595794.1 hypothetical protein [Microcoleus sp. PH2017_26_ELK_O_A]MCC3620596.1 hypothetical protein [Microcoleus sp. PH2017_36_ELK_O_B]